MSHKHNFVPVEIRQKYKTVMGETIGEQPRTVLDDEFVVSVCECGKAKYKLIEWTTS